MAASKAATASSTTSIIGIDEDEEEEDDDDDALIIATFTVGFTRKYAAHASRTWPGVSVSSKSVEGGLDEGDDSRPPVVVATEALRAAATAAAATLADGCAVFEVLKERQ